MTFDRNYTQSSSPSFFSGCFSGGSFQGRLPNLNTLFPPFFKSHFDIHHCRLINAPGTGGMCEGKRAEESSLVADSSIFPLEAPLTDTRLFTQLVGIISSPSLSIFYFWGRFTYYIFFWSNRSIVSNAKFSTKTSL